MQRRRRRARRVRLALQVGVGCLLLLGLLLGLTCFRRGRGSSLASHTLPQYDGAAYLTYQPSGGLSNQLQSILHALHMATVLQRTLVLPHVVDGQQGTEHLWPMHHVVDVPRLRRHASIPLLEMDEFLSNYSSSLDCLLVEVHKPDEGLKRSFLQSGTGSSYQYFRRLGLLQDTAMPDIRKVAFPEGGFQAAGLLEKFEAPPYASAGLLAVTYMYFITDLREIPRDVEQAVRFAAVQEAAAEEIVGKLGGKGEFDCLHLRLGDFLQYCEFLVEERDITPAQKPNVCAPPIPCLAHRLRFHFLAHSPISRPLYVSTNTRLAELQAGLVPHLGGRRVSTLAAFRRRNGTVASAVDMLVCQAASQFVGNVYSSFSLRIRQLRAPTPSRFLGDRQEYLAFHPFGSVGYWHTLLTSYSPPLCRRWGADDSLYTAAHHP
eukprot:GGOE01064855.1.p1 GENE.GGOE01064855.1~~GGOE01064855.1.p1  ORF type:complete len:433 (-),score=103.81 GGOE01064855.1:204-1502(-)